jgi:hypothetical protein
MRNKSFATLGVLALLAAASAFAQQRVKADIPFEFRVGTVVMPAGQYDVNLSYNNFQGMLSLECRECGARTTALTFKAVSDQAHTEGRLVFNRYGDTYFLSAGWSPVTGDGSALPKSRTEREIARSASLAQTRHVTVLLARR